MLNKRVCQHCFRKYRGDKESEFDDGWCEDDERYWSVGKVACPMEAMGLDSQTKMSVEYHLVSIRKQSPSWCPFVTEHVVS